MICPSCGTKYSCPCKTCNPNTPNTKFAFDNDNIKCLTCGLSEHNGWWLDEEVRQLCKKHNVKTLTELHEKMSAG